MYTGNMKESLKILSAIVLLGLIGWGMSKFTVIKKEEASPIVYTDGHEEETTPTLYGDGYVEHRVESINISQSPARNLLNPKCLERNTLDYRLVTDDGEVVLPSFIAVFAKQEGLPECIFDNLHLLSSFSRERIFYVGIGENYAAWHAGDELGVYRLDLRNDTLTHLPVISGYLDGSSEYTKIFHDDRTGIAFKNRGIYVLDITKDTASLVYTLPEGESFIQLLSAGEEGGYQPSYGSIELFGDGNVLFIPVYSPTLTESGARVSYDSNENYDVYTRRQTVKVDSPDWYFGKYILFKQLRTLELPIPR